MEIMRVNRSFGKIVKQISNDYTVRTKEGKDVICKARGKFRKLSMSPVVGDEVIFDSDNNYIMDILKRKNELERPRICNIDQAIIITSLKEPNFDSNLLDKLLCIIGYNNIKSVIVFTKYDLLSDGEKEDFKKSYDYYGTLYPVYLNDEIDEIKKLFKDKVSVFTGQSGAGKSTLLNNLDGDLNIKTGEISLALNRGKHTTRHTELLDVCGGLVADTPGFSALSFTDMSKGDIRDNFEEFNLYRGMCKYRDCMHFKEDGCAVKEKVDNKTILLSRYNNYLNFINKG